MFNFLPHLPFTLKFALILISGVVLLRITGKRSIAQLTVPEAVFMIAIGTVLVQPIAQKSEWSAVYGGGLLAVGMIVISYLQIWLPWLRKWIYGVPSVLVENGQMNVNQLKRCQMTTDELEMRLRQLDVGNVSDVKKGVLEPSGNLSVVLSENKKTAEKADIERVLSELQQLKSQLSNGAVINTNPAAITAYHQDTLFQEALNEDREDTNLMN